MLSKKRKATDELEKSLNYHSGFNNQHSSEALPHALPLGRNNPQKCNFGLYAEQLSGTAFTAPRAHNERSWLYRINPSAKHTAFVPIEKTDIVSDFTHSPCDPNQMRWLPPAIPTKKEKEVDFISGLSTVGGVGDPCMKSGIAIHMYTANISMHNKAFCNADGDFLVVPQTGKLLVLTEFGKMEIEPNEIFVIQRGIRFSIELLETEARGYILELYSGHFRLPDLGPIGANGLANPRDFLYPHAWYEDKEIPNYTIIQKFGGKLFSCHQNNSPYDVVAWHGNYAPYKYDLRRFNCMNSVSYDHPDPSIYTVLTAPSNEPGTAVCDFVIFPPRYMVQENTFRPPWFHRNCMSEFMGMIWGEYDAKAGGFQAGGASLHNIMTPHGPDGEVCHKAISAELKPQKFNSGLAFMFESCYLVKVTESALKAPHRDVGYQKCWQSITKTFDPHAEVKADNTPHF